jgi:hypothetical protein
MKLIAMTREITRKEADGLLLSCKHFWKHGARVYLYALEKKSKNVVVMRTITKQDHQPNYYAVINGLSTPCNVFEYNTRLQSENAGNSLIQDVEYKQLTKVEVR